MRNGTQIVQFWWRRERCTIHAPAHLGVSTLACADPWPPAAGRHWSCLRTEPRARIHRITARDLARNSTISPAAAFALPMTRDHDPASRVASCQPRERPGGAVIAQAGNSLISR